MQKEELIQKLQAAKSVDEIIAIARENGVEVTREKAQELLEKLTVKDGELTDDMLDAVSGGVLLIGLKACSTRRPLERSLSR